MAMILKGIWRVLVLAGLAVVSGFAAGTLKDLVKDSIERLMAGFRWARSQFAS